MNFNAIRRIKPGVLSDLALEDSWNEEPRPLSEIAAAMDEFLDKIWYGRHGLLANAVKSGKTKVVKVRDYPTNRYDPAIIREDIWESARESARRVEKKYGKSALGPWDDFAWGMLSGKLSALRWVMGEEWDMLDS